MFIFSTQEVLEIEKAPKEEIAIKQFRNSGVHPQRTKNLVGLRRSIFETVYSDFESDCIIVVAERLGERRVHTKSVLR